MKKLLFVMNPRAGQRKANRHLAEILAIFNRAGYRVDTYMTAGPGDGVQVVTRRAAEVDLVVCCGGDGTFNEAVTGMLQSDIQVPIGYIPAGSTNDFAASLHLPTNPVKAAQAIVEGQPMTYDVGRFGQRYFAYVASFGAFTRASYATPQSIKNALGHTAYILEGITELPQIHKTHVRLELDGGRVVEDDFIFGAISNSTSVGGVLTLDPKQVDMRDGLFELLLVRAPRDLAELGECIKALRTHQYNCRMITFLSASSVAVTADPHMCWTLDGEKEEGHHRVQVENLRHAIRLIQRTES
jgi:YegS/Rv2252/BmrU family lipid kinase